MGEQGSRVVDGIDIDDHEGYSVRCKGDTQSLHSNGDGINDFTVIEFSLSKISADLKIKIFDTSGSLVTTVFDDKLDPAPWYVKDKMGNIAGAKNMPGYWDGKDVDGDLVPPGVYLFQVVADTDDDEKVESGTVVVGY